MIGDTAVHTGRFRWILVLSDAVIEAIACNLVDADTLLIDTALPKGFSFGADITSIQLTSGKVIAYYQ